jgi:transcriptional regulator with XRE-family HTH domain
MEKQGKWLSKNVGRIFADRRTLLGLTQSEVADALRLQRTSISNIESGNQVLLLDVFYDFCQILKLDPADVINEATSSQGNIDQIEKIVQQVTTDDTK